MQAMLAKGKIVADKRVYDLRITLVNVVPAVWRVIAVSADCTLPEFYRTIQGAFDAHFVSEHHFLIGEVTYKNGKGLRTMLRRVHEQLGSCICFDILPQQSANVERLRSYIVPSRRHYPKVLDGSGKAIGARRGSFYTRLATWSAQGACREEYLTADEYQQLWCIPEDRL